MGRWSALRFSTLLWAASACGTDVLLGDLGASGDAGDGDADIPERPGVQVASGTRPSLDWTGTGFGLAWSNAAGDVMLAGVGYTNAGRGDLAAFDLATGAIRWRLRLGDAVWSSPVVAGNEIYIGNDDGVVFAIHEVNAKVPRLAVFYDSLAGGAPFVGGARMAFEYFRGLGYHALGRDSLARFLSDRIEDDIPSVVVFATDFVPASVMATPSDTVLVRRYLNAGGKIVSLGEPLGSLVRDSIGRPLGIDPRRTEAVLGVPFSTMEFDLNAAHPTAEGKRWGLDRWFRGGFPVAPSAVTVPLAIDELGKTSAWLKTYRPDRPGSGYVQLWGLGATLERLPSIRAVAEYGLLGPAVSGRP